MSLATYSVIVVSYNTCDLTKRCVASVLASQLRDPPEIIVVDNASSDGTVAALRDAFDPLRLVCNQENVGFARAVNQGLAQAEGDVVMLLNPDAYVHPDTLAKLGSVLLANPRIGAVGPWLVGANGHVQHHCAAHELTVLGQLAWHYRVERSYGKPFLGPPCGPYGARTTQRLSGAAFMFPRTLLETVGNFDERFFMYYEDADFIARIRSAGHLVACATDVRVVHEQGASSQQDPSARTRRSLEAELAYFAKHTSLSQNRLLRLGLAGNATLRALTVDMLAALKSRSMQPLLDDADVVRRCLQRQG